MLSETTTKELLAQAAETLDVSPRSGHDVVAAARRSRRHRWVAAGGAAAAAATVAVIAGTVLSPSPQVARVPAPPTAASSSSSVPPSETARSLVGVPILVEYTEEEALQRVQQWGLTAEVEYRTEACRPVGAVIDTRPGAGTKVDPGSTVTLVVVDQTSQRANCPEGVSFDHDRAIARLVYDFSRGVPDRFGPWAPTVTLSVLDDTAEITLTERHANDLGRWHVPVGDAGAPAIDVLAQLAESDGQYRVDVGPHPSCVGPSRPPADAFASGRQISITPTGQSDSCLDWWSVDLFVNDVGQIWGVSLQQSEW